MSTYMYTQVAQHTQVAQEHTTAHTAADTRFIPHNKHSEAHTDHKRDAHTHTAETAAHIGHSAAHRKG